MIATYIAMDSFGTATNVTGDGAIAIVIDRLAGGQIRDDGDPENARELSFDGMKYLDRVSVEGVVSPRGAGVLRRDGRSRCRELSLQPSRPAVARSFRMTGIT